MHDTGLRAFYSYFKLASQTAVRRVFECTLGGSACSDYAELLCWQLSFELTLKISPFRDVVICFGQRRNAHQTQQMRHRELFGAEQLGNEGG